MLRLSNGTQVGPYRIQRFIKDGIFNSSYVVEDGEEGRCFLKLFNPNAIPEAWLDGGEVREIAVSRGLKHENVISYISDGKLSLDGTDYPYLVMRFYHGMLLSEILQAGRQFTSDEIRNIACFVLEGLSYLRSEGLHHNDITPRNILFDEAGGKLTPRIIDLGHVCPEVRDGNPPFPVEDLNLLYTAPEALDGIFTDASDAFSVAVLLFKLICGQEPWQVPLDEQAPYDERRNRMKEARRREPVWPAALHACDRVLQNVVLKGLQLNPAVRLSTARMLEMLVGKSADTLQRTAHTAPPKEPASASDLKATTDGTALTKTMQRSRTGGGFADVAGMDDLKKMLTERVIWVLRDREKAARYRLVPPNGMLLYGPPGCGKTYFAEKFAEESRFNYMIVNGSDLGSTYIHGTQGKIAALFQEAAAKAPTVLCFDEFDSFVPTRGSEAARHRPEEVNEFLSQLNNCARRGIFVIGTTNRMDMIDPAILRKGRLDLQIEIPAPDRETRRLMFVHHLRNRPLADDLDLDRLAGLTDGYAASDIAFIVNDAALVAALADERIAQRHLEDSIRCNPSSLGRKTVRTPIGYK